MHQKNKQANKDILELTQNDINSETKVFDLSILDDLDDENDKNYKDLSVEELNNILLTKDLSKREISKIKKIIKKKTK